MGLFKEKDQETPQSFGKYLLERQQELELSDNETAYLAGSMFGAGSDTTASAISISILAAACFPKAQAKVQEELDNVIGKERGEFECEKVLRELRIYGIFLAPTFADQEMLPQTAAFVMETFRWRPVSAGGMCVCLISQSSILIYLALGFAHKATKDIIWVGFLLSFVFPSSETDLIMRP